MSDLEAILVFCGAVFACYFAFTQLKTGKLKGIATGIIVFVIAYYVIKSVAGQVFIYMIPALLIASLIWWLSHRTKVRREREEHQQQSQQPRPNPRTNQAGGNRR